MLSSFINAYRMWNSGKQGVTPKKKKQKHKPAKRLAKKHAMLAERAAKKGTKKRAKDRK